MSFLPTSSLARQEGKGDSYPRKEMGAEDVGECEQLDTYLRWFCRH